MPGKSPELYNLNKTTIWFAIAAIVLGVGLVSMVLQDSGREWKTWQRHFIEYSHENVEKELEKAESSVDHKQLEVLQADLKNAREKEKSHQGEMQKIQAEIAQTQLQLTKAKTKYQDLKQIQDSERYYFEEYRAHGEKEEAEKFEKRLEKRAPDLQAAKEEQEKFEKQSEAKQAALDQFVQEEKQINKDIAKATQDISRAENKLKKLRMGWIEAILNAPMLDFMKPTLQIQQIVLENLNDDLYFSKVQKVDRCITCHLGIDQKGFEDAPQPFRTHPNLELFLSPTSPHPMESTGCTVCHGGSGHSVSFTTAAHTPQNEEQAEHWKKEYHWHAMKHWGDKMLPLQHTEAACAKCHTNVLEVPKATKLNEGRNLALASGCFGCHKVKGFENAWKAGPDLTHIQSKLESDWIARWLNNPKEFRPTTKMPRIFHLSNTSDPESAEKSNAAIAGIATYLMKNSDPVSLTPAPLEGKPEEGERLIKELGCLGCHSMGDAKANHHGPELTGLGSKVKADWLFTWLKDPKHYSPNTRMPNLRLSDEEATHITSYLLTLKNEKFDSVQTPRLNEKALEDLAMTYLTGQLRHEEAKDKLNAMSPNERLEYVGKQVIQQQGCFGCHDIKGFEDAKQIGTELTEEGSKDVHKLFFGFVPIEETRQSWFFQKLKEPRIFDQGRELPYHEKLRMPQFDFTDTEANSLVTFLLSLQKASIPMEMQRRLDQSDLDIEKGRWLVSKLNCQGCHTLDGVEGRARALFQEKGNAPPIIEGEGKKVQALWLYHFLEHPSVIRPWLKYRMPTFGFNDSELTTVIQYFNQLSEVPTSFTIDQAPETSAEELASGKKLFKAFQCIKCHKSNPDPSLSASFLAPDLVHAQSRLRPDWVRDWLKDPQALQTGTMMPNFFPDGASPVQDVFGGDADKQIKSIRDYLWAFTPEEAASITQG